jgi:hypothetical protein
VIVSVEHRRVQQLFEHGDADVSSISVVIDREVGRPAQQPHRLLALAPALELDGAAAVGAVTYEDAEEGQQWAGDQGEDCERHPSSMGVGEDEPRA